MQKGFAPIFILIGILILAAAGGSYYLLKTKTTEPKICTMDVKTCPDGSSVGRSGPNCEFGPCPSVTPKPTDASPVPNGTGETVNWETYFSRYGFSIKYPPSWKIEEDTPIKPDIVIYSQDNLSNLIISPISEARFTSKRNRNKKLDSGKTIMFAGRTAREYRESLEDQFTKVFVRDIQIEDITDLNWTKPNEISYWIDKSKPEQQETFEQILSTFKFLDQ